MSHLSDLELRLFREELIAAKAEIEALLNQTQADKRPVDLNLPIGRLSRIDAIQMRGMAQMNRQQLDIRRQQVGAALLRFENGTYGLCRSCKGPVGLERLEVLPESPFCIDCQDMFERER